MRFLFSLLVTILSISLVDPAMGEDRLTDEEAPALNSAAQWNNCYWIVSSRNCPQEIQRIGCCPLRVWNVECSTCATETCQPSPQDEPTLHSVSADELRNALIPGVPVCVLVHGSYSSWEEVQIESKKTWRWLQSADPGRPLQFISYTWPSDPLTYLPNVDANVLGKRSGVNGFYLARMMQMIPPECPVCLIGHSHGTRTIASMLHLLQGGIVEGYRLPAGSDAGHRIRVIFAASAIDHDWLNPGNRYGNALSRVDGLLNLRNRRDWILGIYPLRSIGSAQALGRTGWTPRDYNRLGTQTRFLQELDVTALIGKPHVWPTYYQSPELAAAISPYLHFADDPVSVSESQNALLDSRANLVTTR